MFSHIPTPPKRDDSVSKFCTYLRIEKVNDRSTIYWKSVPHLQRHIKLYKEKHEQFLLLLEQEDQDRELVVFWIEIALHHLPQPTAWELPNREELAVQHLQFYCEESCYYAAKEIWLKNQSFAWEDYFAIGQSLIYDRDAFRRILARYNCSQSLFSTYIKSSLSKHIKDKASVSKFGRWRLLCKEKDEILKAALLAESGWKTEQTRNFLSARKCFKQVYHINKVQNPAHRTGTIWPNPDSRDFQESAEVYNTEKRLFSIAPDLTGEELEKWMNICIIALQNYADQSIPLSHCTSIEFLQDVGHEFELEKESIARETASLAEEQGSIIKRIERDLYQQLLTLKSEQQEVMILYYGCSWNQTQIGNRYGVRQDNISHRLNNIKHKLLQTLVKLSQPDLRIKSYIDEWFKLNYLANQTSKDLINVALLAAFKLLDERKQQILQLRYEQKQNEADIARHFHLTQAEVLAIIQSSNYQLEIALRKQMDLWMKEIIKSWLKNFCLDLVRSECDNLELLFPGLKTASPEEINLLLKECLKKLIAEN